MTGVKFRNRLVHGDTAHAVMPPAMSVPMETTSLALSSGCGFWHTFREDDQWRQRRGSSPSAGRAVQSAQPSVFEYDS